MRLRAGPSHASHMGGGRWDRDGHTTLPSVSFMRRGQRMGPTALGQSTLTVSGDTRECCWADPRPSSHPQPPQQRSRYCAIISLKSLKLLKFYVFRNIPWLLQTKLATYEFLKRNTSGSCLGQGQGGAHINSVALTRATGQHRNELVRVLEPYDPNAASADHTSPRG